MQIIVRRNKNRVTLFAAFPAWLNSLPKSGSWLQTVKVSLGYLELAFALKFFSNPDQAYHWGLLKREVFIALWVIIALLLAAPRARADERVGSAHRKREGRARHAWHFAQLLVQEGCEMFPIAAHHFHDQVIFA